MGEDRWFAHQSVGGVVRGEVHKWVPFDAEMAVLSLS